MKRMVNGVEVEIPEQGNGMVRAGDVRKVANIAPNRSLVLSKPGGENKVLFDEETFYFQPDFQVIDQPISERG